MKQSIKNCCYLIWGIFVFACGVNDTKKSQETQGGNNGYPEFHSRFPFFQKYLDEYLHPKSSNRKNDRSVALSCAGEGIALSSGRIICITNTSVASGGVSVYRSPYGDLDTSFHTDGISHVFDEAGGKIGLESSLISGTSSYIIGGTSYTPPGAGRAQAHFQRRTLNGGLDTTFNTVGYLQVSQSLGQNLLRQIALQTDGKVIGVGGSQINSSFRLSLYRILSNGVLDTSFNSTGKFTVPLGNGDSMGVAIAVDTQGRSLVAGYSSETDEKTYFAVLRFSEDGTLDTTFRTSGILKGLFGSSTDNAAFGIALETNGRFVAVGLSNPPAGGTINGVVARYLSNGLLDTSFNSAGFALSSYVKRGVAFQTDGNAIVPSSSGQRYLTNGQVDSSYNETFSSRRTFFRPSFNERGHYLFDFYGGRAVLQLPTIPAFTAGFDNTSSVGIGQSLDQVLSLSNVGNEASITGLSGLNALSGDFAWAGGTFPGNGGNCGTTLPKDASCNAVVRFTPSATGRICTDIRIPYTDNGVAIADSKEICGTGGASGLVLSGFGGGNFGSVNSNDFQILTGTLTNNTDQNLSGITGSLYATGVDWGSGTGGACTGGSSFPGSSGTCGTGLGSGQSCAISVSYCPVSSGAISTGSFLWVKSNTLGSAIYPLSGNATSVQIAFSGTDFGACLFGTTCSGSVTVHNSGNGAFSGFTPYVSGDWNWVGGSYPGGTGTCGSGIASGASCTVALNFTPAATGSLTGTVGLSGAFYTASGALSGTGGFISLTMGNIDFGTVTVGQSSGGSIFITNSGNMAAVGLDGSLSGDSDFSFAAGSFSGSNSCGSSTINSESSCNISIIFTPSVDSARSGVLNVTSSGTISGSLSGVGQLRNKSRVDTRTQHHFPTLGEAIRERKNWLMEKWVPQ